MQGLGPGQRGSHRTKHGHFTATKRIILAVEMQGRVNCSMEHAAMAFLANPPDRRGVDTEEIIASKLGIRAGAKKLSLMRKS
jgi:hypothetical protein